MQARAVDALVGTHLRLPALHDISGLHGAVQASAVVWIADPGDCAGCLDGFEEWNRMAAAIKRPAFLVLLTDSLTAGHGMSTRSLKNTTVLWALRDSMNSYFPLVANHTKLVVDEGVIVVAHMKDGGQYCGWSFEAQVATLLAGLPADRIRSVQLSGGQS